MATVPEIDGYRDLVEIGRGGFGIVYRARQDRHGRDVALKVLTVENLDEAARKRFKRECIAMGSLSWHPHVVSLFDSGITPDGHPFLVMEYLEQSLGDRVKQTGPLDWGAVLSIGVQVSGALGAAHTAGVLHRDLKPENLLVGPFGEVKLSDFGIAAVEGGTRSTTGHLSFSIDHVAPEVLRREPSDERSDVYGLGSTLYTLIAGQPPFAAAPGEPDVAVIASVLHDAPPRLSAVPTDLADVVQAALAKEPDGRPSDAEQFGRLLQLIQADNNQPVTELRLSRARTAPGAGAGESSPPSESPTPVADHELTVSRDSLHAVRDPRPTIKRAQAVPADNEPAPPAASDQAREPAGLGGSAAGPTQAAPVVAGHQESSPPSTKQTPARRAHLKSRKRTSIAFGVTMLLALGAVAALAVIKQDPSTNDGPSESTTSMTPSEASAGQIQPEVFDVGAGLGGELAVSGGTAWVARWGFTDEKSPVPRVDSGTGEVTFIETSASSVSHKFEHVDATADAAWVVNVGDGDFGTPDGTVTRIDSESGAVGIPTVIGVNPQGVAVASDAVWVTQPDQDLLTRVDLGSEDLTRVEGGDYPDAITAITDQVWVANALDGTVTHIDSPSNEVVGTIEVGESPVDIDSTAGAVWVANRDSGTVTRIDPATDEVVAQLEIGGSADEVAATDDGVWVLEANANISGQSSLFWVDADTNEFVEVSVPGNSLFSIASNGSDLWGMRQATPPTASTDATWELVRFKSGQVTTLVADALETASDVGRTSPATAGGTAAR